MAGRGDRRSDNQGRHSGGKPFGGGDSNGYSDQGGHQRKRRNESDSDLVDRKRGTFDGGDEGGHLKMLMSNMVAGAIIGKGAENIKNIQKDTGVRIQISKAHDFYPGTQDRVCLISGANDEKVLGTFDFILEKLFEKKDPEDQSNDDEVQLKLVIANSSAGMIIGKSGSHIKHIKETSGCHFLNISQKSDDPSLKERILTAVGTKSSLKEAVKMIMEKISEDQFGTNLDISYGGGGGGNFNNDGPMHGGGGRGSQSNMAPFSSSMDPFRSSSGASSGGAFNLGALAAMQQFSSSSLTASNSNNVNLSINLGLAGQESTAGQLGQSFERIKNQLRQCGLSDFQIMEVYTALNTLAKYGVLGVNSSALLGQNDLGNKVLGAIGKVLEECLIQKSMQAPPMQPPPMPDMSRFDGPPPSGGGGSGGRSSRWGGGGGGGGDRDRRN